jgi:hypothetical protein
LSGMSRSSLDSTPTAKRVNLAYVELPSRPYLTPKSVRRLDSDDLGGYGSHNDSPLKRMGINDSVKSSARRTGDRDERGIFTTRFFLTFDLLIFYLFRSLGEADIAYRRHLRSRRLFTT